MRPPPRFTVLNDIGGDLSDGHAKFRAGLAALELDAPNGMLKLDGNRQAIGTNFVTEVVEDADGNLVNQLVKIIPDVSQTLGLDPAVLRGHRRPGTRGAGVQEVLI